ncbi:MAG: hypothetical protein ACYDGM_07995 [Vulcanimicrobiaceae bacterium]
METKGAERSSGYAAFAYVLVVLVAGLLPGNPPAVNDTPGAIAGWVAQHQGGLLVAAWLSFPGLAFFLWYVVGLRAYLHDAPGQDEGLGTYVLAAGVLAGAFALLNAFFQAVLGYRATELGPNEVRVLYDAFALSGTLLFAPLAIFTFAASHSARRHGSFSGAFAGFGYLTALLLGLCTLSIFFKDGPLRPNAELVLVGLFAYGIWTIWTGVTLVKRR